MMRKMQSPEEPLPVVAPAPLPPLPSKGSVLHSSGQCKPCGFFWKAGGCSNGRECRHCHLCPESEIKTRKHKKMAEMRKTAQGSASQAWLPGACADSMAALPMYVPLPFPYAPLPLGVASPTTLPAGHAPAACYSWDLGSWRCGDSCGLSPWATSTFQEGQSNQGTEVRDEVSTAATATGSSCASDEDEENLYSQELASRRLVLNQSLPSQGMQPLSCLSKG